VLNVGLGLIGFLSLWLNPSSLVGRVFANLLLLQLVLIPSTVVHEFAHAIVGRLSGLTVLRVWIGRGKTFCRANVFGFDTKFKTIPMGGFAFLSHGIETKLRLRYFLAILAGPLSNLIILMCAWNLAAWREFDWGRSIQLRNLIVVVQIMILVENLLPYRIQTAVGRISTDGRTLLQLILSKSPDVLNPNYGFRVVNHTSQPQTFTK